METDSHPLCYCFGTLKMTNSSLTSDAVWFHVPNLSFLMRILICFFLLNSSNIL